MKSIKLMIIAMVIGLFSLTMAQEFFDGPPPMGPKRKQVEERIKTVKIWKLTEELDLTTEQSQAFFPIYNKFDEDRKNMEEERMQLMMELRELTAQEKPDEKKVIEMLNKFDEFDTRIKEQRAKFRKDIEGILTVTQIGRLYVFEMNFMHQMREIIQDARRGMHGNDFKREK